MPDTRVSLVVFLLASLGACTKEESRTDSATTVTHAETSHPASPSGVTPYGLAPLRAGMSLAEARAAVPSLRVPADAEKGMCSSATSPDLPDSVRVMIENAAIARIEVFGSRVKTAEGVGVGDTEARVKDVYGNRVAVSPHKYTSGHYLTVRPTAAADSSFAIVFETDSARVLTYRAGREPQVHYVEGCS